MKTITLTDDQFETLFDFVDERVEDIVDFMIGIMNKEQLNQVEDMLTNQYPED